MSALVLVVDDDPVQRSLMEEALRGAGFEPRAAGSAVEGLRLALESPPALLVTDIDLPDETGFRLCERIREQAPLRGTPILMVTGTYLRDQDRLRAETVGADAYLAKPFRLAEFLALARRLAGVLPDGFKS